VNRRRRNLAARIDHRRLGPIHQVLARTGRRSCGLRTTRPGLIGSAFAAPQRRFGSGKTLTSISSSWQLSRVLVAKEHVLICAGDASIFAAVEERGRIARRHLSEHALLFERDAVRWSEVVEAGRLERPVRQLLEHETGVQYVRFAGSTDKQDAGRDLLVEWDTPLFSSELDPDVPSSACRRRRVVVQCKSDARAVGIGRVSGVGDTLDQYDAGSYLLVVRSRLTLH
jgi:hypothetical protein